MPSRWVAAEHFGPASLDFMLVALDGMRSFESTCADFAIKQTSLIMHVQQSI